MSNAYIVFNRSLLIYPVRQKNARGMRKAILLSKRTSSLSQGLHAPQGSHDLRPTRTAKKGAYFQLIF
ncbi:unnamed protein product [Brassica rapa]|uniref:Uncharacterized protein n=1 Tax=Brassica campestris TaxID=3711 RepID=A0A8D9HFF5_BRACM|nr:unnamed protein product [Brassica rapa]